MEIYVLLIIISMNYFDVLIMFMRTLILWSMQKSNFRSKNHTDFLPLIIIQSNAACRNGFVFYGIVSRSHNVREWSKQSRNSMLD